MSVRRTLGELEFSPLELAWHIADTRGTFFSEPSVYRIPKAFDLAASPAYVVLSAEDRFDHPSWQVH